MGLWIPSQSSTSGRILKLRLHLRARRRFSIFVCVSLSPPLCYPYLLFSGLYLFYVTSWDITFLGYAENVCQGGNMWLDWKILDIAHLSSGGSDIKEFLFVTWNSFLGDPVVQVVATQFVWLRACAFCMQLNADDSTRIPAQSWQIDWKDAWYRKGSSDAKWVAINFQCELWYRLEAEFVMRLSMSWLSCQCLTLGYSFVGISKQCRGTCFAIFQLLTDIWFVFGTDHME
jgi:hypothetical protein